MKNNILEQDTPQREQQKPKVSVVIPCYNHAIYLPKAVESVLNQTFTNFEIVIVNDGSTDNSRKVALELIAKNLDANIILINQPNSGLPTSRNNGIKASYGYYIFVLDADDKIHPKALELMADVLDKHDKVGLVYSDYRMFGVINKDVRLPDFDPIAQLEDHNITGNCMFRRDVWEDVGGYNANMKYGFEDWDFTLGVLEKGWEFHHIKKKLFFYRKQRITMLNISRAYAHQLVAQMFLNHQSLYSREKVERSKKLLIEYKNAESLGAKKHGPLISVIIPTYNNTPHLREILLNIKNQVYKDIEVIIMTNNSFEISNVIDDTDFKEMNIRIGEYKKEIPVSSKNSGAKIAKGKYLTYLDGNTKWYPEHISTLVESLEMSNNKVAYTEAFKIIQIYVDGEPKTVDKTGLFCNHLDENDLVFEYPVPTISFLQEKECLYDIGFFDETLSMLEDWDLWIRMSKKYKIQHIRKITSEFIQIEDLDVVSALRYLNSANIIYTRLGKDFRSKTHLSNKLKNQIFFQYKGTFTNVFRHYHPIILLNDVIKYRRYIFRFFADILSDKYTRQKIRGIIWSLGNGLKFIIKREPNNSNSIAILGII